MDKPNILVRFFRFLGRVFGFLRALIQVLFLLVFVVVLLVLFQGGAVSVPDRAALILAPTGQLVEQSSEDPLSRALSDAQGLPPAETPVADLVEALESARDDKRIEAVVLDLGGLDGGGLSKLRTVAAALTDFRSSGKPVVAMGDAYSQSQYYLAAHADEVFLHQLGNVYLDGFAYFRAYFREALDKLKIDINVFRVGEYKTFLEPFTRNDMSAEDRQAARRWLESLWAAYRNDVVQARNLAAGTLNDYAGEFAARVEAAEGNLAQVALDAGLVDALKGRAEFEAYMVDQVGEAESPGGPEFASIGHVAYLRSLRRVPEEKEPFNVGVVVAAGQIVDGEGPPGTVGGDSLAALIGEAAEDDAVDAVVLRVDSPGGSVFASEVIFEAVQQLKATGKPVVASMGSVAASGGYYIAMPADEIVADPTTITGSIGVGALLPTFERSLRELGIRTDGLGTTVLSGQGDVSRQLGPELRRVLQASVDNTYRLFVGKVAESREMSIERVENIARGRVWVGEDALDLGLVDGLGGLEEAVEIAADRAGLQADEYGVRYIRQELDMGQQLALRLISVAAGLAAKLDLEWSSPSGAAWRWMRARWGEQLDVLARLNDPRGLYYLCSCELR